MIHNNEIVSIEEVLIKPQPNYYQYLTRKFIFTNRSTNLKLRVTSVGATIDSCEINDHQIIVSNNNNEESTDERPWDESHVFGFDTLSLSFENSPGKNIVYQLTKNNEFIIEGKGFNSIVQNFLMNPCFFNLNSVEGKPSLDGHYLRVRSSHDSIEVVTEPGTEFSQFISNTPSMITDFFEGSEMIYSTNAPQIPNSHIMASLSFDGKSVDVFLELEQWVASHLRIQIKNGSIAFIPHNMSRFRITFKFNW